MPRCPRCENMMVKFSAVRLRRKPYSREVEKILVTGFKCSKCGHERFIKKTSHKKENQETQEKIIVQPPQKIFSK